MRIIAGTFKGRPIKAVPSKETRPTTDKVREALFQRIGPFFNGGLCLDLFAGSGALGFEALSRGVDKVIFVDAAPKAISTVYANIELLRVQEQTEVFRTDALRAIKAASKREFKFNYIFLDPPYHKISYEKLLTHIEKYQLLEEDGMIVCEHDAKKNLDNTYGDFIKLKTDTYGNSISVSIYIKGEKKVD